MRNRRSSFRFIKTINDHNAMPSAVVMTCSIVLFLLALTLTMGWQPSLILAQDEPTPLPLYDLPLTPTTPVYASNTLAFSSATSEVIATNMLSNTFSIIAPLAGEVREEIQVGNDPRSVAVTDDGAFALITNRGDATLTVYDLLVRQTLYTIPLGGAWAYGVVTDNDERAYVSMQGSSEVIIVNLITQQVETRIPTPAFPTALALWGDFLYVSHLWSGDLSLIYLPQNKVVNTTSTGQNSGLTPSLDIDPTRGTAYMPQTRSFVSNTHLTYDTVAFPIVNAVQLGGLSLSPQQRINIDTADRPVNMPFAVEIDPFRRWIYVANAGSNDISVIEMDSGLALANIEVGVNPRGILLSQDRSRLYVNNAIDGTLSFVEISNFSVSDTLPITTAVNVPIDVIIGAELFHSTTDSRLTEDRWLSCANCHLDGMSDQRIWQGLPEGSRNTPMLFGVQETAPYNWSQSWDELADVELKIRDLQAGSGLIEDQDPNAVLGDPHTGLSLDLDTLVIYLSTLEGPTSPEPADPERVTRGEQVFVELECNTCHALPIGTDQQAYDVGTGGTFDTPSLRWLWLSAPYFHDGSAATIEDVLTLPGAHDITGEASTADLRALIAYLMTIPSNESLTE